MSIFDRYNNLSGHDLMRACLLAGLHVGLHNPKLAEEILSEPIPHNLSGVATKMGLLDSGLISRAYEDVQKLYPKKDPT